MATDNILASSISTGAGTARSVINLHAIIGENYLDQLFAHRRYVTIEFRHNNLTKWDNKEQDVHPIIQGCCCGSAFLLQNAFLDSNLVSSCVVGGRLLISSQ